MWTCLITGDVNLDHLGKLGFAGVLHWFFYCKTTTILLFVISILGLGRDFFETLQIFLTLLKLIAK